MEDDGGLNLWAVSLFVFGEYLFEGCWLVLWLFDIQPLLPAMLRNLADYINKYWVFGEAEQAFLAKLVTSSKERMLNKCWTCEAQANSAARSLKLSDCSRPTKHRTLTAKFWNPSASPQATSGRVRIVCISFSASWCGWHTDTLRLPVIWWKVVDRWHRTVHYGEQKVDVDDPAGYDDIVQVHLLVRGSRKPSLALQTH